MPDDRETRRRLRSVEMRSEDVVLVRHLLAIALRLIGALLGVVAVAEIVSISAFALQPGWGGPTGLDLVGFYGGPTITLTAGVLAFVLSGALARRLAPARVPRPCCPACGYQLTTLDDGRCTECAYELTPARDGPMSSTDRVLFVRSLVATGVRLVGIGVGFYGVGQFALLGLTKFMLFTPALAEQYLADRSLLWSVVLIVLGIAAYALAEWIARVALLGLGRATEGPTPPRAGPSEMQSTESD
jgi:hypothetical protein